MRRFFLPIITTIGLTFSLAVYAQAPTVTATCKDGTSFSGASRKGACRGHKGVQSYGTEDAAPAATAPAGTAVPSRTAPASASQGTPGAGQVWVNTKSKVYHCPGDRYYGKTKVGEYMSEAQAKSAGDRPDHGKACTS